MQSYHVKAFTGGMNNALHGSFPDANTARELVDCDVSNGKLKPARLSREMPESDPEKYGHYGNRNRSVVKWYGRTYWSENKTLKGPYYGGHEENYLGIPYPEAQPTLVHLTKGSGETGQTGNYKYCITYVNANGFEGAPGAEDGVLWAETDLDDEWCIVRAGRFPENVSYAKVYRTAADGADFYCIGEITESGGQLTDKTPDGTAQMLNPLESENSYPPPDGGRFLTEYGGVFFLGVGERLYFSERENPHGWPRLNFIGMGDRITGIAKETQGLLVFTRNNCYHITGTDSAETITKYEVPGNQGCPDFRSIASLNNTPVWVSNDGLCMWTGSRIAVISNRRIRKEDFTVRYAATANDCYYLFTADGCLVYDLRNGSYDNDIEARIGIFYKLSETAKYAWYDGDGDMLFLYDGKTVRLSGGGERGEWRYASPYIGGTECAMHRFHEMEIAHTGKIELTVFCDGKPVFSRVLSGDGRKKRVKFPWTAGQRVNIEMTGNGELNEYAVFFE